MKEEVEEIQERRGGRLGELGATREKGGRTYRGVEAEEGEGVGGGELMSEEGGRERE